MNDHFNDFKKLVLHPVKFRMFLFMKIPSAFFSGVRIRHIDPNKCVVSVPYKWFSQNPFRSTYFACLSMAAEMSTGALGMGHIYKRKPGVSMLVVRTDGEYFKKSVDRATFTCDDGDKIKKAIEESIATGEGRTVTANSTGKNNAGEVVAEFRITWSFKAKSNGSLKN